jgi:hypothetical protein
MDPEADSGAYQGRTGQARKEGSTFRSRCRLREGIAPKRRSSLRSSRRPPRSPLHPPRSRRRVWRRLRWKRREGPSISGPVGQRPGGLDLTGLLSATRETSGGREGLQGKKCASSWMPSRGTALRPLCDCAFAWRGVRKRPSNASLGTGRQSRVSPRRSRTGTCESSYRFARPTSRSVGRLRVQNQLQQMAELRQADQLVLVIAVVHTVYDHQIASRDNDDKVSSDASCRE